MIKQIPLLQMYKNTDPEVQTNTLVDMYNCYVDKGGAVHRRPGLTLFKDTGVDAPIDGLFYWKSQQVLIVVCNGNVYKISDSTGTQTTLGSSVMSVGTPVIFSQHDNSLIIANGANPAEVTTLSATTFTGTGVPTAVTHVAYLDQYLICNEAGTNRFHFSEVGTPTVFRAIDFATAETRPDNITAIHAYLTEEFSVFGDESVETWYNNGVSPFARVSGRSVPQGTLAPYSIIYTAGAFIYFSNDKQVVILSSSNLQVISQDIWRELQDLDTVTDAYANLIQISGRAFYLLTFPTEERTFVYDLENGSWTEWSYWNVAVGKHEHWVNLQSCYSPDWNKTLVGDRNSTGYIFEVDRTANDDNGDLIRAYIKTGHVNHGSNNLKLSSLLRLRIKRGTELSDGTEARIMIRWKDNNGPYWANERSLKLGATGETDFFVELRGRLGQYRTRQYEFNMTDAVPYTLVSVEEDIEVLNT